MLIAGKKRYRKRFKKMDFPGVYACFNSLGECIYVGASKNIGHRLSNHSLKGNILGEDEIARVRVLMVNDKRDRHLTESRFIKWYTPKINVYHNPQVKVSPGQCSLFTIIR